MTDQHAERVRDERNFPLNARFRGAGLTDPGMRRQNNEDNFLIDRSHNLLMVADGLGGHEAGEVASAMALAVIRQTLVSAPYSAEDLTIPGAFLAAGDVTVPSGLLARGASARTVADGEPLTAALNHASDILYQENQRKAYTNAQSMGTTIVGLLVQGGPDQRSTIFHVGDSRLYLFRDGRLTRMTTDHSAYEQWLATGRVGPMPPKNVILQALGPTPSVDVTLRQEIFRPGDIVMMCSDGLSDMLDDNVLSEMIAAVDPDDLTAGCERLIDEANRRGGVDNITVILGAFI